MTRNISNCFLYADEAYELLHDEYTPDKYDRIDIILEKLRDYTVKHFADEEQYMESINYKKLFTQKIQHQEFIHKQAWHGFPFP